MSNVNHKYSVRFFMREGLGVDYSISRLKFDEEDFWDEGIVEMGRWGNEHDYTVLVVAKSPEEALEKAVNNYDPVWRELGEKGEEAVDQPGFGGSGPSVA